MRSVDAVLLVGRGDAVHAAERRIATAVCWRAPTTASRFCQTTSWQSKGCSSENSLVHVQPEIHALVLRQRGVIKIRARVRSPHQHRVRQHLAQRRLERAHRLRHRRLHLRLANRVGPFRVQKDAVKALGLDAGRRLPATAMLSRLARRKTRKRVSAILRRPRCDGRVTEDAWIVLDAPAVELRSAAVGSVPTSLRPLQHLHAMSVCRAVELLRCARLDGGFASAERLKRSDGGNLVPVVKRCNGDAFQVSRKTTTNRESITILLYSDSL